MDKAAEVLPGEDLKVVAMPNPNSTNFRIIVPGVNVKDPVKLFVTDMFYAVRLIQGKKTRQLRLIKISD